MRIDRLQTERGGGMVSSAEGHLRLDGDRNAIGWRAVRFPGRSHPQSPNLDGPNPRSPGGRPILGGDEGNPESAVGHRSPKLRARRFRLVFALEKAGDRGGPCRKWDGPWHRQYTRVG